MSKKSKLLYVHIPKTGGVYLSEYITQQLEYRQILSDKRNAANVWTDYTLAEVVQFVDEENVFLPTHTLSFGWHNLCNWKAR